MPSPSPIGAFTPGTARLLQPGAVEYDDSNVPKSVTDTWGVVLAYGTRASLSSVSGLPAAGAAHPDFPSLVRGGVTIRSAAEMAGSLVWMIEVSYAPQGAGGTSVENPGDDPDDPGVESAVCILEKAWPIYEVDADFVADCDTGDPVLNSAGEPYDRVPTIKRRYMGARVKRAEQNWPKLAASLDGTLNQSPIYVLGVLFPSRCARLEIEIEDTLAVGSDTRYHVTYNIVPAHNVYGKSGNPAADLDAGFDVPLVEQGFSYLDGNGNLVRATVADESGNQTPTALPVLLDASGGLLAANADPVVHVWHTYKDADWSNLELPEKPLDGDPPTPEPDPNSSDSSSSSSESTP